MARTWKKIRQLLAAGGRTVHAVAPDDTVLAALRTMAEKDIGALAVIAEGVETEQQLALLAREGCDYYQGFLRSAAVSSEELAVLVGSAR